MTDHAVMDEIHKIQAERDGREVRYQLADPELVTACQIGRSVLARRVARMHALSEGARIAVVEGR